MKLHLANTQGIKLFTAYGDDYVAVNHEKHQKNLILLPDALNEAWTEANVGTLTEADRAIALGRITPTELPIWVILRVLAGDAALGASAAVMADS